MTGRFSRRRFLQATPAAVVATGAVATGLTDSPVAYATPAGASATPGSAAVASSQGISIPPGWGQFVGPKLTAAASGSAKATIALVGDSVCRGFFSSNLDSKGWGGLLAAGLHQRYGDGGSGFKSTADSATWMNGVSGLAGDATIQYYQSAGNLFVVSGTWTAKTANWLGPGGVALQSPDPTASLTATIRGSSAKVIWLDGGADAFGSFTVTIDNGPPVIVKPTGMYRIAMTEISALATGTHAIRITATGATPTTQSVVIGIAGENPGGCLVNQFSRYGQISANLNNSDVMQSGTWHGGWNYPADLVIYALGANDAHAAVSGDTWARNLRGWLGGVYDSTYGGNSTGAVDGIVVLSHIGGYDQTTCVYQDYAVRALGIAQAYGWAFVDIWTLGRNSWNYWKNQDGGPYWANADDPGTGGGDLVHLSNAGHQFVANTMLDALTANLPS